MRIVATLLLLGLGACSTKGGSSSNDREQARSYARGSVPCVADTDCCLVVDECINQGLVVRAADKDAIASLVSQPDPGGCTGCLLPAVQVTCAQGQCAGAVVDPPGATDGGVDGATYQALTHDHCGAIAGVPVTTSDRAPSVRPQAILGCGPK